ncbi:hypothetical protein CDAR_403321 [Caerostris darwini]|uniref:Uncharacterized protein n=1 Tax=Caerostris darwini TaxID=1538125 RepID=A0AAV4NTZ2_9ARAC|nr:hypothetical protein CDAR_403321 [Caerostris darwini]
MPIRLTCSLWTLHKILVNFLSVNGPWQKHFERTSLDGSSTTVHSKSAGYPLMHRAVFTLRERLHMTSFGQPGQARRRKMPSYKFDPPPCLSKRRDECECHSGFDGSFD